MGKIAKLLEKELKVINCKTCDVNEMEFKRLEDRKIVFCNHYNLNDCNWNLGSKKALELEKAIREIMEEK